MKRAKFKIGECVHCEHDNLEHEIVDCRATYHDSYEYRITGLSGWFSEWMLRDADSYTAIPLRYVKHGEMFKLSKTKTAPVWVKDEYNRSDKKFEAHKYDDTNHWQLFSPGRVVYINFYF